MASLETIHPETGRRTSSLRDQALLDALRNIVTQLPGAVYVYVVGPDGLHRYEYVSEGCFDIFGLHPEDLLRDPDLAFDRIHPDDLPQVTATIRESLETLEPWRCTFRLKRENGERWIAANSMPTRREDGSTAWYGYGTDVTESVLQQRALLASEQRWNLALAGSQAAVWDWDIRAKTVFYSDRWEDLLGWPVTELPGTPAGLLGLVHEEDRGALRARMIQHLKGGSPHMHFEYRMCKADGGHLWVLGHGKAQAGRDGRATRMIGTVIDISDRKLAEAEILAAKEAAEAANRAKVDFLAMMSHEIRTPLNGILGFTELLSRTPLDSEQADYVNTISESGSMLMAILNDLLDYSRIESGNLSLELAPLDVRALARSAVDFFQPMAAAKGLDLECRVARNLPASVVADASRLRQIFNNLISNAIKFTTRGRVAVRVSGAGGIAAPIQIQVRDTGIGIPRKDQERLFEPFHQLEPTLSRRFGGAGLGLAIVRNLAEMMGGGITLKSRPGNGSTFAVRLPLRPADAFAAAQAPDLAPEVFDAFKKRSRKPHILLVEDNPVNRRLVRLMLDKIGCRTQEAENGFAAIELTERHRFDLILMDLQMPGMDGYEAAAKILERGDGSSPRIVALTAHAMPEDEKRSAAIGMEMHLTKPVKLAELWRALRLIHDGRQNP